MQTLALVLAAISAQPSVQARPASCAPGPDRAVARPKQPPRARPLNEMPPARTVLAVDHQVDGCRVLLIREGGRITEEPVGRPERRRVFRP